MIDYTNTLEKYQEIIDVLKNTAKDFNAYKAAHSGDSQVYNNQLTNLTNELKSRDTELKLLKDKLLTLNQNLTDKDKDIIERLKHKDFEILESTNKLDEKQLEINNYSQYINVLQTDLNNLYSQNQLIPILQQQITEYQQIIETNNFEIGTLKSKINEIESTKNQLIHELEQNYETQLNTLLAQAKNSKNEALALYRSKDELLKLQNEHNDIMLLLNQEKSTNLNLSKTIDLLNEQGERERRKTRDNLKKVLNDMVASHKTSIRDYEMSDPTKITHINKKRKITTDSPIKVETPLFMNKNPPPNTPTLVPIKYNKLSPLKPSPEKFDNYNQRRNIFSPQLMKTYADEPSQVIQLQPIDEKMEEQKINPLQPSDLNKDSKITLDMPINDVIHILKNFHGFKTLSFGQVRKGTLSNLINNKTDIKNSRDWWNTIDKYGILKNELQYIAENNLMDRNTVYSLINKVQFAIDNLNKTNI